MAATLSSLLIGLLFGAGLTVSGMIDPRKVLNFLDVAGHWDPTLGLVMGAALAVAVPGFALVRRRDATLLGGALRLPDRSDIDLRLIGGGVLFGVGWGLAGLCPGPAIAALTTGVPGVAVFVVAMLAGMAVHRLIARR